MRTIKFRGRRLDNKGWVFGNLALCDNGRAFIHLLVDADEDCWLHWEVDPNTVGQFTGIFDGDGTEIYEGDLLFCDKYLSFPYKIHWTQHFSGFLGTAKNRNTIVLSKEYLYIGFKVIGNIYDNPELMEGVKK